MKFWYYLGKICKWILWFLLLGILLFLIIGYAKFDGGIKDYGQYLNQKDRNTAVAQVDIFNLSSYGSLFWSDTSGNLLTGEGYVLDTADLEVEELDVDMDTNMDDDVGVFDPEFADDFESFFAEPPLTPPGQGEDSPEGGVEEGFGFVESGTGSELSGADVDVEDIEGDEGLSDNKKSLLKLFGR